MSRWNLKSIFGKKDARVAEKNLTDFLKRKIEHDKNHALVEQLVEQIDRIAVELFDEMKIWIPVAAAPGLPTAAMIQESWRNYCIAYAYALVSTVQYRFDPRYFDSGLYVRIHSKVLQNMTEVTTNFPKKFSLGDLEVNPEHVRKVEQKTLIEARVAVDMFIKNISAQTSSPDLPLVHFLLEKIGFDQSKAPSDKAEEIQNKVLSFTKATLRALMAKA